MKSISWQEDFDMEFFDDGLDCVSLHDTDPDDVKDFISSLLKEEKEKIPCCGHTCCCRNVKIKMRV